MKICLSLEDFLKRNKTQGLYRCTDLNCKTLKCIVLNILLLVISYSNKTMLLILMACFSYLNRTYP